MGQENSSTSSVSNASDTQVILNVYDLTPLNQYTSWVGFGIFHSGIEVHGMEYGFGAHDFSISGVFEVEPKSCPGFIYKCSVRLGRISMSPSEFRTFIETVASEYHGDTYHLISKNCNHFTDDMARRLTGKGIPGWVNRLAHLGAFCSCLLPESLQLTTVKQLPEYHPCTEEACPIDFGHFHGPEIDDGSASSTSTPGELSESDDGDEEDKQRLLSTLSANGDVAFVKESSR